MTDPLDDLLDAASETLRDETSPGSESGKATQWAVIDGLQTRQRRKDWALASSIAFCVLFVAPTVWAHVTGRLDALVAVVMNPRPSSAPATSPDHSSERRAGVAPSVRSEETALPETPVETLPETGDTDVDSVASEEHVDHPHPLVEEPQSRRVRPRPARSQAALSPEVEPSLDVRERELFARAHRSHFDGGTPPQTLVRWDEYLAAYPAGHYVPEARYNRALTLVRLGDYSGARVALERFARGDYGAGRRSQARELLELIATDSADGDDPSSEDEVR